MSNYFDEIDKKIPSHYEILVNEILDVKDMIQALLEEKDNCISSIRAGFVSK